MTTQGKAQCAILLLQQLQFKVLGYSKPKCIFFNVSNVTIKDYFLKYCTLHCTPSIYLGAALVSDECSRFPLGPHPSPFSRFPVFGEQGHSRGVFDKVLLLPAAFSHIWTGVLSP